MSSEELAMLPLEPGKNMATYHVPALEVTITTLLCFVSLIQYISSSWASNHFYFDIHFSRSPFTLTSSSSPAGRSSSSQMLMERLQGCCRWAYHLWVCNCAQGRRGCCCCRCCRWSHYLCVCIIAPREDVMGFVLPSVVGITHHQVFSEHPRNTDYVVPLTKPNPQNQVFSEQSKMTIPSFQPAKPLNILSVGIIFASPDT